MSKQADDALLKIETTSRKMRDSIDNTKRRVAETEKLINWHRRAMENPR